MIGEESVSQSSDVTRLAHMIRAGYKRAGSGDVSWAKLLLERGWGHVPQIVADASKEVGSILESLGLTIDDVRDDPLAKELFRLVGGTVPDSGSAEVIIKIKPEKPGQDGA